MPISLMAFTISDTKIAAIDIIDNPGRIAAADLTILDRRYADHPAAPAAIRPGQPSSPT